MFGEVLFHRARVIVVVIDNGAMIAIGCTLGFCMVDSSCVILGGAPAHRAT
ncbi:hypothetical protein PC117_g15738 [Phytophthora cactorum]|uniref:Uncharacterized protein n=1 Tax=Phytophthora cactorum TaxID=29920 RepID=A0A8T1CI42_9STRA|nr:hypothetical protein PC117_g15738 [Phytophthora cactorum]